MSGITYILQHVYVPFVLFIYDQQSDIIEINQYNGLSCVTYVYFKGKTCRQPLNASIAMRISGRNVNIMPILSSVNCCQKI